MPLTKKGKNCVSKNISELHHSGTRPRSNNQIIAIAESACGNSKNKGKGGGKSKGKAKHGKKGK